MGEILLAYSAFQKRSTTAFRLICFAPTLFFPSVSFLGCRYPLVTSLHVVTVTER
jgi:hypothetical protein